jgi:hypothetical protein
MTSGVNEHQEINSWRWIFTQELDFILEKMLGTKYKVSHCDHSYKINSLNVIVLTNTVLFRMYSTFYETLMQLLSVIERNTQVFKSKAPHFMNNISKYVVKINPQIRMRPACYVSEKKRAGKRSSNLEHLMESSSACWALDVANFSV